MEFIYVFYKNIENVWKKCVFDDSFTVIPRSGAAEKQKIYKLGRKIECTH